MALGRSSEDGSDLIAIREAAWAEDNCTCAGFVNDGPSCDGDSPVSLAMTFTLRPRLVKPAASGLNLSQRIWRSSDWRE